MKKTVFWLIFATVLILAGVIIFVGVMSVFDWNFSELSGNKYEENEYTYSENIININIDTITSDIEFISGDSEETKLVCYEEANVKHKVELLNGELKITAEDTRKWYHHIGINFNIPKITIYLPKSEYGNLTVNVTTGDIIIAKDFRFESIDIKTTTGDVKNYASAEGRVNIKTTTGDIKLKNVNCKSLDFNGTTGDVLLENVIAEEKFTIKATTGDVNFNKCDAGEIEVKTNTGDIKGTLLSDKKFVTKVTTGKCDVPKTTEGGTCSLSTTTGDIKIKVE